MKILLTICARGGSKGIPGKNIKIINGKPLIAYTIASAKKFAVEYEADIVLSTDCEKIKEVAKNYGLETLYTRPSTLATDTTGKIEVIKDILNYTEDLNKTIYDFILDLDITSPLRTQDDLRNAFKILQNNDKALNIFSVSPASRNPYFNMVEMKSDGYFKIVKDLGNIRTRQTAPPVYDMNASFYFYRREYFRSSYNSSITDKSLCFVMDHLCFDLDEPFDFQIMDLIMRHNLLNFEF